MSSLDLSKPVVLTSRHFAGKGSGEIKRMLSDVREVHQAAEGHRAETAREAASAIGVAVAAIGGSPPSVPPASNSSKAVYERLDGRRPSCQPSFSGSISGSVGPNRPVSNDGKRLLHHVSRDGGGTWTTLEAAALAPGHGMQRAGPSPLSARSHRSHRSQRSQRSAWSNAGAGGACGSVAGGSSAAPPLHTPHGRVAAFLDASAPTRDEMFGRSTPTPRVSSRGAAAAEAYVVENLVEEEVVMVSTH